MKDWIPLIEKRRCDIIEAMREADEDTYWHPDTQKSVFLWGDGTVSVHESKVGETIWPMGDCVCVWTFEHQWYAPFDGWLAIETMDSMGLDYRVVARECLNDGYVRDGDNMFGDETLWNELILRHRDALDAAAKEIIDDEIDTTNYEGLLDIRIEELKPEAI